MMVFMDNKMYIFINIACDLHVRLLAVSTIMAEKGIAY